jgi:hypothetical protein
MQTPSSSDARSAGPSYAALRIFALVVLALMLISIVYSGWIAIENWGAIRV